MAHQKIVKEINNKLSELTEQLNKISVSDEIHLIEVDILMGMMRELYLKTSLLKEPEPEEAATASPSHTQGAPFIPEDQPMYQEHLPEFKPPSTPHLPEEADSFETQSENKPTEIQAPLDYIFNLPIVPELKPEDEVTQPEITTPVAEIAPPYQEMFQSQPEPVQPEPEMIKQEKEMVQPEAKTLLLKPELVQPTQPESIYPPTTPYYTSHAPSHSIHQADLFGNGSLSDKYKTEAPSINDRKIEGKSDHTLADKINLTPISDIKSAIGINEKFQFINELFDGSAQLYNEAIALLNNCTGAEAAHTLFRDYQVRNNWDTDNKAFLQFREYIERRYLHS